MHDFPAAIDNSGWYVEELVSTLVLSARGVRLVEWWSIVAMAPLDEVLVELNLDGVGRSAVSSPRGGIEVSGGETTDDDWPLSLAGRRVIGIRLPVMLEPGQGHHLDLVVSAPHSAGLRRHAFRPPVPCRRLELRVHFGRLDAPVQVHRIVGSDGTIGAASPVDPIGDVSLALRDAVPGLLYGMVW